MSSNVANLEQRLHGELDQAVAQLQRLERQYEDVLADPGVLQEDRDATRCSSRPPVTWRPRRNGP